MPSVVVIGGGIVGASVAWNLAVRGSCVLVMEREVATAMVTSAASFSRASAFGKKPHAYFDLNHRGLRELWRLHHAEVPGFQPCPSLVWTQDTHRLEAELAAARQFGYQIAASAPAQLPSDMDSAVMPELVGWLQEEGWVDLPVMAAWMLGQACEHGAEVRTRSEVTKILRRKDGAVRGVRVTDGEELLADVVVNAAGVRGEVIARLVGGPLVLAPTQGLLAEFRLPGGLDSMVISPDISIRPAGQEVVLVRSDRVDALLGATWPTTRLLAGLADELSRYCAAVFPAVKGAKPLRVRVGVRANPADGRSSIGFLRTVPGYYEAVTHSGATLGPLLGRLIAEEITSARPARLLAPYAPDRFGSYGMSQSDRQEHVFERDGVAST